MSVQPAGALFIEREPVDAPSIFETISGLTPFENISGAGTSIWTVAEMNEHGARSPAYAAEIVARGGSKSLIALFELPDNWIAYCAAAALVIHGETKEIALATLDRIADECSGGASFSADIGCNMYNPRGIGEFPCPRARELSTKIRFPTSSAASTVALNAYLTLI